MKHPQSAVMVNIFMPCELMHAMGLQPMFPEGLAVYVACTACQQCSVSAEEAGVPERFCSYQKTMHRHGGVGRFAQAPAHRQYDNRLRRESAVIPPSVGISTACRRVSIDVPSHTDDDAVSYVADQLRALAQSWRS